MERFTSAEANDAKKFGEFFIDLLENHKETLVYYLADTAILDWFGHTVKGPKNIGLYLKNNAGTFTHHLSDANPVRSIGFRETHVIKYPSESTHDRIVSPSDHNGKEVTPPQLAFTPPTQTHVIEKGQGDGPHNNCETPESPVKKCKLDIGQGDSSVPDTPMIIKYISTEGSIEFRKKSSKKLQGETKWNRPCKLEVGYSANNFEDCTIYMMIYQGNMKCRRNLLKEFEECEPDD